ncbi:MAG: acyl--CoA ligase [Verrucomicrobia bacterium]|nr:acyl--CoA ligase [Verrucomicrobiota bacterium]
MNEIESALRGTAAEDPDRLAIQHRDRRLSFGEITRSYDEFAARWPDLEAVRIFILLPDGLTSYLAHLFFFLRRATVIPVSVRAATANIAELSDRVRPHLVVTTSLLGSRHSGALSSLPCLEVDLEDVRSLWADRALRMVPERCCPGLGGPVPSNLSEQPRLIVFTSGSTGKPKGVCLSEGNVLAAAGMMVSFLNLQPSRRSLVTVPLFDYYGFIQIYGHLLARTGYVLGETIGFPDSLCSRLLDAQVTDLVLVPHSLRELLRFVGLDGREVFGALRFITSSSDVLTTDLLEAAFSKNPELKIFNIYGLTEAGRACYREIDRGSIGSNSIGRPSPGVEIAIDTENETAGEIIIRGPNVMLGYMRAIENGGVDYEPCREIRTGDLGRLGENGEILLLGRRDHLLNIMGSKIHPAEIEAAALRAAGVKDARARSCTAEDGRITIRLDLVLAEAASGFESVQRQLRTSLPSLFVPQEYNVVSEIVRTELGSKVVRSPS